MKLKESRFTFKTDDGKGGLLIYNALKGTKSFLHIMEKDIPMYESYIGHEIDDEGKKDVRELLEKGILVFEDKNEDLVLKRKYLDLIGEDTFTLIINPTEQCNFACKYCYESFENKRMDDETQNNLIRFIEKNIHHYKKLHVMWFGGEPLLEVDIIEYLSKAFMDICKRHHVAYIADMTSNGYLLDLSTFERLIKCHVFMYQITLDGIENTHDSQRISRNGKPTYNTIVNNIQEILKKSHYKHFSITIRVNVSKQLFEELDEFISTYNKVFYGDKRIFVDFHLVGNWLDKTEEDFLSQILEKSAMKKVYEKVLQCKEPIHNIGYSFLDPGGRVCYAGKKNSLMISSNGTVHKCTLNFNLPESQIGKIGFDGTLEDYKKEVEETWICNDENCKLIKQCYYAPVCFGDSCPSAHSNIYAKKGGKGSCPEEKNNMDLLLKIIHRDDSFNLWEVFSNENNNTN